uniref:Uncharacterized protein n=1 Tax=Ditylenchus dipsaci TaxID=166011 RepID=A0A915D8H1_9BILA
MDQSDVKYLLKQQNIHLQSQGFSALISAIKTENDAKKKKYLHGILMECLQSECGNLSCWASEAIVLLQSSSNPGTLLDEVMASVRSEGHNVHTLIDLLFRMVNNQNGGNKTALGGLVTRLSKMLPVDQTHLLLEHVKQLPMAKSIPIASKLIHSPHLNSGFKLALLSQTLAAKQENVHKCLSCLLESITNCFIMPNLYLFANQLITYPETASDLLSSSLANNPHYLAMLLPIADCKDNMFEVIGLLSCGNLAQAQAVLQLSRIQLSEHPSYLPSLLSLYSIVQELNKCKVLNPDFPVEVLKKNLQACQLRFSAKQGHFVEGEHVETLTEYLAWIVQKKSRCANFLKFWLQSFQANSHAQTLHTSLAFVSGLYAFLDDASECTDLFQLCNLLAEAPIL